MPHVMLKKNWPGVFHRSVRTQKGELVKRLAFAPGEPVELDELELAAVSADLRKKILVPVNLDAKRRPRVLDLQPAVAEVASFATLSPELAADAPAAGEPVLAPGPETADAAQPGRRPGRRRQPDVPAN